MLQPGETITADLYQQQLTNLSDALEEKWPFNSQGCHKMILLHDNPRNVATYCESDLESYLCVKLGTSFARGV